MPFQHSCFSFASSIKHSYPSKQGCPKNGPLLLNCTAAALACSTLLGPQALAQTMWLVCQCELFYNLTGSRPSLPFSNRGIFYSLLEVTQTAV